jgi:hypothetical protein
MANDGISVKGLELALVAVPVVLTFVGAVVAVEMRYAKASDVQALVKQYYDKTVQLRLLELELKGGDLKPYERALLEHLKRELKNK